MNPRPSLSVIVTLSPSWILGSPTAGTSLMAGPGVLKVGEEVLGEPLDHV